MEMLTRKQVEELKQRYPEGTRVKLVRMDDPYRKMAEGTEGTVELVDDIGTIHVKWDVGIRLGVVPGIDEITKVRGVMDTDRNMAVWENEAGENVRIYKDTVIDDTLKEQILQVRDTGAVNMFDIKGVRQMAEAMGLTELVRYLDENRKGYTELILYGGKQKEDSLEDGQKDKH